MTIDHDVGWKQYSEEWHIFTIYCHGDFKHYVFNKIIRIALGPGISFDISLAAANLFLSSAVDWQKVASNNFYAAPARQTKDVGRYTAEMIDYLCMERGADIKKFHLVGHSLGKLTTQLLLYHFFFKATISGAHTVGYAGSYVKSGKIPRISGEYSKMTAI